MPCICPDRIPALNDTVFDICIVSEIYIVQNNRVFNHTVVSDKYLFKDDRIKYNRLEKNSGAAVARTEAMRLAAGSYMAFLDSDDLWKENKLENQIKFMQDNKYNFTCTAYEQIDEQGNKVGKVIQTKKKDKGGEK